MRAPTIAEGLAKGQSLQGGSGRPFLAAVPLFSRVAAELGV